MSELMTTQNYAEWLEGELANGDDDRTDENRARIGAVFGVTDQYKAERIRLNMITNPLMQEMYEGALLETATLENQQYDKETTDEKTRILNSDGLQRWVTRQFQLPPGDEVEAQDRRLSNVEERNYNAAVLFGDLCNFKLVNDVFGHDNADELLKHTARIVPAQIQFRQAEPHAFARIHGDEYVGVVHGVDEDDARLMLERLQTGQLQKLATEHAQQFWNRVRKVAAGEEEHEATVIKDIDEQTGAMVELYLQLGDLRLTVDEAAIISLGMSHGSISSYEDFIALKNAADEAQTASKEEIHNAMGGAYRPVESMPQRFGATPFRLSFRGLAAWAMRHRHPRTNDHT